MTLGKLSSLKGLKALRRGGRKAFWLNSVCGKTEIIRSPRSSGRWCSYVSRRKGEGWDEKRVDIRRIDIRGHMEFLTSLDPFRSSVVKAQQKSYESNFQRVCILPPPSTPSLSQRTFLPISPFSPHFSSLFFLFSPLLFLDFSHLSLLLLRHRGLHLFRRLLSCNKARGFVRVFIAGRINFEIFTRTKIQRKMYP